MSKSRMHSAASKRLIQQEVTFLYNEFTVRDGALRPGELHFWLLGLHQDREQFPKLERALALFFDLNALLS